MTRFVLAGIVSMILLGSVGLCQVALTRVLEVRFTRGVGQHQHQEQGHARAGPYDLVVTPAFDTGVDPFSLADVGQTESVRIRVARAGKSLLAWRDDVKAGEQLRVEDVLFGEDHVELYVEAVPTAEAAARPCALRVQMYQDDVLYGEQTVWTEGGGALLAQRVVMPLYARYMVLDRGPVEDKQ